MDTKIISERLVTFRKRKKLTQIELADQINYSDKVISKWERGESLPSIEAFKILADFYEVSIDDLIADNYSFEEQIDNNQLSVIQTQGPSKAFKVSILIPIILFLIGTGQALWDAPSMFWVWSIVILFVYLIIWSILIVYVTYESSYKGHTIKFVNKPLSANLYIDGIIVDSNTSIFNISGLGLTGKINNKTIKVKVSANASIKCLMFVE